MSPAGPRSVLLAGGGTAGHVSPLLALADCLRRRDPDVEVAALGTSAGLEARLVPERGYRLLEVPKVPFPRRPSGDLLRLPTNLRRAIAAAEEAVGVHRRRGRRRLRRLRLHARLPRRAPPGRPRRRPRAERPPGPREPARRADGPRRRRHLPRHAPAERHPHRDAAAPRDRDPRPRRRAGAEARDRFGLTDAPTVLVTGGSLGAQRLNDAFAGAVADLSSAGVQVLHVTGTGKAFDAPRRPRGAPYVVLEYCDRMDLAYAAADLVVAALGRQHRVRAHRRGPARASTSRCRSATASSGSTPGRSSPRAAACSSRTPPSTPPGCARRVIPLADRRRPPRLDGRRVGLGGRARR